MRRERQESPVRDYTPARRDYSADRREYRRDYSPARRNHSPVRREETPRGVPVRDRSPARRYEQYGSEHSSHASNRATTSGSPVYSSSSGRRSTIQFTGSSTGRSGRRYDD